MPSHLPRLIMNSNMVQALSKLQNKHLLGLMDSLASACSAASNKSTMIFLSRPSCLLNSRVPERYDLGVRLPGDASLAFAIQPHFLSPHVSLAGLG